MQNALNLLADAEVCWDFLSGCTRVYTQSRPAEASKRAAKTHHVVERAVDSVVLFQKLLYRRGPGEQTATITAGPRVKTGAFSEGKYSLERRAEGFVFPYEGYSDQAVPLLSERGASVLVSYTLSTSATLVTEPKLTWKLMGGGGFFGSILTTLDSTFGGGRKLFFPT